VATYSLSGHPSAGDLPTLYVGVDALHLLAVSLWVGGVLTLALFARHDDIADEVRRFSRVSTLAMPVAVVTGVVQSLNLIPSREVVTETQYGKYLIAKVVVVGLVVLAGLYVRRKLRTGDTGYVQKFLRRESVLVIAVIALTAFMVGESPVIQQKIERRNFSVTLVQKEVVGDFQVLPAKVGTSEVHAWFMPPGGMLAPVGNVLVSFELPAREIPKIPVKVVETGPNHWSGITQLPYEGDWTMEVRAVSKDGKDLVYSTTVAIER
jgi:copper transport protein